MAELEAQGLVDKGDGYQALIVAISKDIKSKGESRKQRKREIARVKDTLSHAVKINQDLNDQKEYYKDYIGNCIEKTRAGKGYYNFEFNCIGVRGGLISSLVSISDRRCWKDRESYRNLGRINMEPTNCTKKEFWCR